MVGAGGVADADVDPGGNDDGDCGDTDGSDDDSSGVVDAVGLGSVGKSGWRNGRDDDEDWLGWVN